MAKSDEAKKNEKAPESSINMGSILGGVLLIALGVLFLLQNFNIIQLHLENIWQLWPLAIIAVGISLLNVKGALGIVLNSILIVAAVALAVIGVTNEDGLYDNARNVSEKRNSSAHSEQVIDKENDSIRQLDLDIKTGALGVLLGSNPKDNKLVEAKLHGNDGFKLKTRSEVEDATQKIFVETSGKNVNITNASEDNRLNVDMGKELPTKLKLDAGASSVKGDLSEVKLRELILDTGATSIDLKLGDKEDRLDVDIDTGVSSITLRIPESTGVRVTHDGGLSSTNFENIPKKEDGVFESTNFDSASKQVVIKSDIGVSSFKIVRY